MLEGTNSVQTRNCRVSKTFARLFSRVSLVLALAAMLQLSTLASQARGGDQLQRDTDQLVSSVQTSLTMQGKWPPPVGSQEMQLCTALQAFSQEVKRTSNLSGNNPQLAGLQASAAGVDSYIGLAASSPDVASRWMSIKNQLGSFGGSFGNLSGNPYGNPYYQGSVNQGFNPGFNPAFNQGFNPTFNQGFNPAINPAFNSGFNNFGTNSFGTNISGFNNPGFNNNFGNQYSSTSVNVSSHVSDLNNAMRDFSNFSQKSLGSGGFNAGNPSAIFAMANALQQLQSTVKSAGNSLSRSNSFGQQQMQVQQMAAVFSNFEAQFNQAGPSAPVQMRYAQLKQQFAVLQQAVFMNAGRLR
ncbi:hypothetical protein BH11CYA1_BH11CYA1_16870 [soil metagenome]